MKKDLIQEILIFIYENNTTAINKIQQKFRLGFNATKEAIELLHLLNVLSKESNDRFRIALSFDSSKKIIEEYFTVYLNVQVN